LEGLIVEEPPTPLQPISEIGVETETIARTNSQAIILIWHHQHRLKFKDKSVDPHPNTLAVVKLPAVEEPIPATTTSQLHQTIISDRNDIIGTIPPTIEITPDSPTFDGYLSTLLEPEARTLGEILCETCV